MKQIFILLSFALAAFTVNGQKVSGSLKDNAGQPLQGATISLMKDSSVVKLAVSGEAGQYSFSDVPAGNYKVAASHVGYEAAFTNITIQDEPVSIPELKLEKSSSELKGVTVTARKPIIEVKADKMILNVEGTINSSGSDALELLRKAPGVMVDKDENLSVSGKNGVQVFIDGRPSPLAGQDLANYLKTLQAAQIESIEIITNPSARYEAAGNAGIINIRLKKNKSFGTNGSLTAGYSVFQQSRYNGGISLNHRNKLVNIYGNYNYSDNAVQGGMDIYRTVLDSVFDQHGNTIFKNNAHNVKVGLDYSINKRSTIGMIASGSFSDQRAEVGSKTLISYQPTGATHRILEADNSSKGKRDNMNFNLNYSYTSGKGNNLSLNADRGTYSIGNTQLQPNVYYDQTGQNKLYAVSYEMVSPTEISIHSVKADYDQAFLKGKLGFGGKFAAIRTDNDFRRYNVGSTKELDRDRSNRFTYDENINAGYVNYNRALKGFMIQAGLRVENTVTEGRSIGEKFDGSAYLPSLSGFSKNYTDFFPSAAITFNKNPMKVWNLTYSRRIDRPAYQDLNPFEFKLDEYTFQKGNTNLRPQYTNSIGLTHTYKFKLNATLNYSHVKDIFTQLIDTAERSKSFISKQNLATQDIFSLNVSYPFMYKAFTSFINMNANHSSYQADFGEGRKVDLDAFGLTVFSQNSIKFGKNKLWTGELTGVFIAPTIWQGAFRSEAMGGIDLGLQRMVMEGKGTVKIGMSDVLGTFQFKGTTDFAGQVSRVNARWESQQFKLNFTYRFGNSQVKAARQKASGLEEEAKRVQSGGGIGTPNN